MNIVKQKFHKDFKTIHCKSVDPINNFVMDPGCYVLIKVENDNIHLGIVNYDHEILVEFTGKKAQDIYYELIEFESKNKEYITRKEHMAYIGKELKKAEYAIENKTKYIQE